MCILKDILSVLAILLGAGGSILTLYTIRLISVKDVDAFTEIAAFLSKDADPTPSLRKKKLFDPHNKKIMLRFKTGIAFICIGAIIQIIVIFSF